MHVGMVLVAEFTEEEEDTFRALIDTVLCRPSGAHGMSKTVPSSSSERFGDRKERVHTYRTTAKHDRCCSVRFQFCPEQNTRNKCHR